MSYLHDEIDDESSSLSREKEVTLSTAAILGIFFGLVLLCAVFFGFGYSMGTRSRPAPIAAADPTPPATTTGFSSFKPSAGSPAGSSSAAKPAPSDPTPPAVSASQPAPIVHTSTPTPVPTAATRPNEPAPRVTPATETGLSFIVQVAAVSHQEDADLLVASLKRKGYAVNARNEPQDKLLHIQVGPFAAKRDADAMRQRLQTDGYNAIVK